MPEFDGPGHAWSWAIGYPEILPDNYQQSPSCSSICPSNPCDVPIDPSNNFTFTLIDGLFDELTGGANRQGIFTEDLLHLGGDEVEYGCWNESEQIAEFMQENNMSSFEDLYMYFINRTHEIALKYGRTPVNWEEVFIHFGKKLNPQTVIHVWLDHSTLAKVVEAGYRGILSDQDVWYLDHLVTDWTQYYLNDPFASINESLRYLVLGGQACMWGENVDPSDIFSRVWPKAAVVAERLWNYENANEANAVELAIPRLQDFRCRLLERGIDTAPLFAPAPFQPGSCYWS